MRRIALCLLLPGCFNEAPDTKTVSTTAIAMTTAPDEGSSSSEGASSSDGESSSSGDPVDPGDCPEWCASGCDLAGGIWAECRCGQDYECHADGLSCDRAPEAPYGHCRAAVLPEPQHTVCPTFPSWPAQSGCSSGPSMSM